MCKKDSLAKSSQEEVVSDADASLMVFVKPTRLYEIIHKRSVNNPSFLARNLKYIIKEKGKTTTESAGVVLFHYKDCNNVHQKTEVRENYSCPFCDMLCGSFTGLKLHLNASHDLFEFECLISEGTQTVNVTVRVDGFKSEDEEEKPEKFEPFSFCMKRFKRRQIVGRKMTKRPRPSVTILKMDATKNENPQLNNRNPAATPVVIGPRMTLPLTDPFMDTDTDSDADATVPSEAPPAKTRKLTAERLEARSKRLLGNRQFHHSHTFQPMSFEQVISGQDSEDEADDEVAEFEDRQMLDDFVDVNDVEKRFMHLWNTFVRKQRVVADGHIPWACEAFSTFHKKELNSSSELLMCWRVFMIKLWNLGLLDAVGMNKSNRILHEPGECSNKTTNNNNNGVRPPKTGNVNQVIDLNDEDLMDIDEDDDNSKDK